MGGLGVGVAMIRWWISTSRTWPSVRISDHVEKATTISLETSQKRRTNPTHTQKYRKSETYTVSGHAASWRGSGGYVIMFQLSDVPRAALSQSHQPATSQQRSVRRQPRQRGRIGARRQAVSAVVSFRFLRRMVLPASSPVQRDLPLSFMVGWK